MAGRARRPTRVLDSQEFLLSPDPVSQRYPKESDRQ
jgi:hypothetical protein